MSTFNLGSVWYRTSHSLAAIVAVCLGLGGVTGANADEKGSAPTAANTPPAADSLSSKQQAIVLIAAFMASSDMPRLNEALNQGLDACLTINEAKEVLVQLYAYTGFPRSLNALGELLTVVEARKQRGIEDARGMSPAVKFPPAKPCVRRALPTRRASPVAPSKGRCSNLRR